MFRNTHRLLRYLIAAIAVVALAVPATSAAVDYRNPDSKDAANLRSPDAKAAEIKARANEQGSVDLRSPDAKAAEIEARANEQGSVDLRSPDARDAGRVAQSPPPPPEIAKAPGFAWGDAGIGAGSVLGLLLIMLSVVFAGVHRRGRKVEGSEGTALTT